MNLHVLIAISKSRNERDWIILNKVEILDWHIRFYSPNLLLCRTSILKVKNIQLFFNFMLFTLKQHFYLIKNEHYYIYQTFCKHFKMCVRFWQKISFLFQLNWVNATENGCNVYKCNRLWLYGDKFLYYQLY